jgi:hypothetical protein
MSLSISPRQNAMLIESWQEAGISANPIGFAYD